MIPAAFPPSWPALALFALVPALVVLPVSAAVAQDDADSPLQFTQDKSNPRAGVIISVANPGEQSVLLDSLFIENCHNIRLSVCGRHHISLLLGAGAGPVMIFHVVPQVPGDDYRFRLGHAWSIETVTVDTAPVYIAPRAATPLRLRTISPLASLRLSPSLGIVEDSMRSVGRGVWIRDLQVGNGELVDSGAVVAVHYVGMLADGRTFSATDRKPFSFTLGANAVIAGWEDGVLGMRVGGRRQLVIPPHLGYGAEGDGAIPPDAVLVFDVTVVEARPR